MVVSPSSFLSQRLVLTVVYLAPRQGPQRRCLPRLLRPLVQRDSPHHPPRRARIDLRRCKSTVCLPLVLSLTRGVQNPLGCAVATAALEVIQNEDLSNRADRLGKIMRDGLEALKGVGPAGGWITEVRGMGLLNAIVIDEKKSTKGRGAWDLCLLFKSKGLLAKPTHVNM